MLTTLDQVEKTVNLSRAVGVTVLVLLLLFSITAELPQLPWAALPRNQRGILLVKLVLACVCVSVSGSVIFKITLTLPLTFTDKYEDFFLNIN